uniref:NADH-ubiquinone oxidoreductase chain 6 n=1 Tax=Ectoneura hanitschi TaxID=2093485 RepID=A0A2P1H9G0_9NEOP|nr:NADH dehydrogenase subunit 6 [Ectoneura hanitschi]
MMLLTLTTMICLIFTKIKHPMSMGLLLLLQTILLSMMSGLMSKSFWFSYILFLVFLGGMLILFIYMASLAPNEMFYSSNKFIIVFPIIIMLFYMIWYYKLQLTYHNQEMFHNMLNSAMPNLLIKLYNKPTNIITIMLALYLFLTLIAVVKITNIFKGPLRSMF